MLNRTFGVLVTFIRGVRSSDEFTVRRSRPHHQNMGAEWHIELNVTMRDFILPAASVVIEGETLEPRKGDRIKEGDEVFEISPPDDKLPAVELLAGGYEWLCHAKRVE